MFVAITSAGAGCWLGGVARWRRQGRMWRGWREQSFLELMSQLFSNLDFSIGSEARYPILIGAMIVQFNLEHNRLLRSEGTISNTYRPVTRMSRASDENLPTKQAMKVRFAAQSACRELAV